MKIILTKSISGAIIMRIFFTIVISIFFSIIVTNAQIFDELSNPKVALTLTHPPGLGLKVNKIAFGPATGPCADEIVDALISRFVDNGIEVIDRKNLTAILAEHDFTFSGYVDPTSAAAIGKIIGPSALIFVKVQRCTTMQDRLYDKETKFNYQTKQNYTVMAYYSRTRVFLKASVQTVDLATGRIFSAQTLDFSPEEKNKSYEGYPEAPSEFDVKDLALRMFVGTVRRMFLPWTEKTELYYFDDKTCGLKQAYQALDAGDLDQAFNLSKANLETCKATPKVKDKILAHANYNLGISYMIQEEYDLALESFQEAARLRPGEIVSNTIADCQRAKDLKQAMLKVEEKASIEAERSQDQEKRAGRAEAAITLTNTDIIELTNKKLPTALIIQKIKTSKCKFDTTTDALIALSNASVNEEVIMAMMEK